MGLLTNCPSKLPYRLSSSVSSDNYSQHSGHPTSPAGRRKILPELSSLCVTAKAIPIRSFPCQVTSALSPSPQAYVPTPKTPHTQESSHVSASPLPCGHTHGSPIFKCCQLVHKAMALRLRSLSLPSSDGSLLRILQDWHQSSSLQEPRQLPSGLPGFRVPFSQLLQHFSCSLQSAVCVSVSPAGVIVPPPGPG